MLMPGAASKIGKYLRDQPEESRSPRRTIDSVTATSLHLGM